MKHTFISYVRDNSETVDRLCRSLSAAGVKIWLDRNDIKPGQRWKQAIKDAIRDGAFFIACFSKEFEERSRTFMNEELVIAIDELRLRPTDRSWFIPVLLSDCRIPERPISQVESLSDLHYVELFDDWDAGLERILSAIRPEDDSPRSNDSPSKRSIPSYIESLVNAMNSIDQVDRERAAARLVLFGKEAISPVTASLAHGPADTRYHSAYVLGKLHSILPHSSIEALIRAVEDFQARTTAIPALGKLLSQEELAFPRSQILSALVPKLEDKSIHLRIIVAEALAQCKAPAQDLIDLSGSEGGDGIEIGLKVALHIIGHISIEAVLDGLTENISSRDAATRAFALWALSRVGAHKHVSLPMLLRLMEDSEMDVRRYAAILIKERSKVDKEATTAVNELVEVTLKETAEIRSVILDALGNSGSQAIPILSSALGRASRGARKDIESTLKNLPEGASTQMVEEVLTSAMNQGNVRLSTLAATFGAPAVAVLSNMLWTTHPSVQSTAFRTLEKMETPEAREALSKAPSRESASSGLFLSALSALAASQISWLGYPFKIAVSGVYDLSYKLTESLSDEIFSGPPTWIFLLAGYLAILALGAAPPFLLQRRSLSTAILALVGLFSLSLTLLNALPDIFVPPYLHNAMKLFGGLGFSAVYIGQIFSENAAFRYYAAFLLSMVAFLGSVEEFMVLAGLVSGIYNVDIGIAEGLAKLTPLSPMIWASIIAVIASMVIGSSIFFSTRRAIGGEGNAQGWRMNE